MALPAGSVPSTLDTRFLPTLTADGDALDHYLLYQSISMQEPYKHHSPEELRFADLIRLPVKPKTVNQLKKELEQKSAQANELQLRAFKLDQQLQAVTQQLKQKSSEVDKVQAKVAQLTQEKVAIEDSLESTLKSRTDKMKAVLNKSLVESRKSLQDELLPSVEKAREEGRAKGMEEGRIQSLTEGRAEGLVDGQTQPLNKLSGLEVRQFLASNPTVKEILATNLKKKLSEETTKIKAEYEAKLKVYKSTHPAQVGVGSDFASTNASPSASRVASSKPTNTTLAPKSLSTMAANSQTSTSCITDSMATNHEPGPARSPESSVPGNLTTPLAKTAFSTTAPVIKTTIAAPTASVVKTTSSFQRSLSVPPKSLTPVRGPVVSSPFSKTKSFDSSNIFGRLEPSESNGACAPSNIFGCSDSPAKNIFASHSTRARSTPSEKPVAAITFGSANHFQPSSPFKSPATFATSGWSGRPSSTSPAPKQASKVFGTTNSFVSSGFGAFAPISTGSKESSFASPSTISFPPKNDTVSPFAVGHKVLKTEPNVQKRTREEESDREKRDLKKGRVVETK